MVKQDFLRAMECIYEACIKNCDPDRCSGRITEMVMNVTLKPKLHEIAISWLSADMLKVQYESGFKKSGVEKPEDLKKYIAEALKISEK